MRNSGDFWGGFAAMLVALPASVAFGVTVYSAVSPQYAAFGALAGILGATALGLIAPTFGGTDRLISAPCAPAAAVLSAFAIHLVSLGVQPVTVVLMITVLGILTGLIQILIGFLGIGKLIKYIPYPVVSGYLSGVGLIIIGSQLPKFAGAPAGTSWFEVLIRPQSWDWRGLAIGFDFGFVVGLTMLGLFFGWLQTSEAFADTPAKIGRLVHDMHCATPGRYLMLATFITVVKMPPLPKHEPTVSPSAATTATTQPDARETH